MQDPRLHMKEIKWRRTTLEFYIICTLHDSFAMSVTNNDSWPSALQSQQKCPFVLSGLCHIEVLGVIRITSSVQLVCVWRPIKD